MERLTFVHSLLFFGVLTLLGAGLVYAAFYLLVGLHAAVRALWRGIQGQLCLHLRHDPWQDVALPDAAKADLKSWQRVLVRPRAYQRRWRQPPPSGLLLHGPPGVGKGLIAQTLAASAGYTFMAVTFTDGLRLCPGGLQNHLLRLYDGARQQAPSLVLLRHFERVNPSVLETALQGTVHGHAHVFTVGTTEHLNAVDPRLRALFTLELAIDLPDQKLRERLFALYTRPYRKRLAYSLEELARASEGLSGQEIRTVCQTAAFVAHSWHKRTIGYEDFAEAFKRCRGLARGDNRLKEPCFMCQGDDLYCPACRGTGYVEVAST